jgi:hypothetical protein
MLANAATLMFANGMQFPPPVASGGGADGESGNTPRTSTETPLQLAAESPADVGVAAPLPLHATKEQLETLVRDLVDAYEIKRRGQAKACDAVEHLQITILSRALVTVLNEHVNLVRDKSGLEKYQTQREAVKPFIVHALCRQIVPEDALFMKPMPSPAEQDAFNQELIHSPEKLMALQLVNRLLSSQTKGPQSPLVQVTKLYTIFFFSKWEPWRRGRLRTGIKGDTGYTPNFKSDKQCEKKTKKYLANQHPHDWYFGFTLKSGQSAVVQVPAVVIRAQSDPRVQQSLASASSSQSASSFATQRRESDEFDGPQLQAAAASVPWACGEACEHFIVQIFLPGLTAERLEATGLENVFAEAAKVVGENGGQPAQCRIDLTFHMPELGMAVPPAAIFSEESMVASYAEDGGESQSNEQERKQQQVRDELRQRFSTPCKVVASNVKVSQSVPAGTPQRLHILLPPVETTFVLQYIETIGFVYFFKLKPPKRVKLQISGGRGRAVQTSGSLRLSTALGQAPLVAAPHTNGSTSNVFPPRLYAPPTEAEMDIEKRVDGKLTDPVRSGQRCPKCRTPHVQVSEGLRGPQVVYCRCNTKWCSRWWCKTCYGSFPHCVLSAKPSNPRDPMNPDCFFCPRCVYCHAETCLISGDRGLKAAEDWSITGGWPDEYKVCEVCDVVYHAECARKCRYCDAELKTETDRPARDEDDDNAEEESEDDENEENDENDSSGVAVSGDGKNEEKENAPKKRKSQRRKGNKKKKKRENS